MNFDPKKLGLAFALAVTCDSSDPWHWVARQGEMSVFRALQTLLPEVIKPDKGRVRKRGMISRSEFNKYLQAQGGFACARSQIKALTRGAGHWLFSNRRLLDPRTPQDLQTLQHNYDNLCNCFPVFASVTRARFLECFTAICTEWSKCLHDAQFGTGSASPDEDSHGDREGSSDQRGKSSDGRVAARGGTGTWQPPSKRARGGRGGAGSELVEREGGNGGGGVGSRSGSWQFSDSDASSDEESDSPGPPALAPHSTRDLDQSHSDSPPNHDASHAAAGASGGSGGGGGGSGEAPDSESVDRWYPVAPLQSGEVDYDPLAAP